MSCYSDLELPQGFFRSKAMSLQKKSNYDSAPRSVSMSVNVRTGMTQWCVEADVAKPPVEEQSDQ
jgi:hypothetical protein